MNILPFKSIGGLHFGERRVDLRQRLGERFTSFKKDVGENETDAYDELGVHLYFDDDDSLEYVETFAPATPTLDGIKLVGRILEDVRKDLEEVGHKLSFMDAVSARSETAG